MRYSLFSSNIFPGNIYPGDIFVPQKKSVRTADRVPCGMSDDADCAAKEERAHCGQRALRDIR